MIQRDLASNLIPVSLLILACVMILRCASSNSIWLWLRASNDPPLITRLSTVDTPQSVSPDRANRLARLRRLLQWVGIFLGPLRKTGRPGVMARAGRKIRFVCILCALACVRSCVCVCLSPSQRYVSCRSPLASVKSQVRLQSPWDQRVIVAAWCHWHVLSDIITRGHWTDDSSLFNAQLKSH